MGPHHSPMTSVILLLFVFCAVELGIHVFFKQLIFFLSSWNTEHFWFSYVNLEQSYFIIVLKV